MSQTNLALYYYDACPFCQYVLNAIKEIGLNDFVELRNIQHSQEHFQRLVSDTGRRTVPCLYINDVPMFESADIINWLNENQEMIKGA